MLSARPWLLLVLQCMAVLTHDPNSYYGGYDVSSNSRDSPRSQGVGGYSQPSRSTGLDRSYSFDTRGRSDGFGTGSYGGRSDGFGTGSYGGRSTGLATGYGGADTWSSYNPISDWSAGGGLLPSSGKQDYVYGGSRGGLNSLNSGSWVDRNQRISDPWSERGSQGRSSYGSPYVGFGSPSRAPITGSLGGRTTYGDYPSSVGFTGSSQPSPSYSPWSNTGHPRQRNPGVISSNDLMERYGARSDGGQGLSNVYASPAKRQQKPSEINSNQLMEQYGYLWDDPQVKRATTSKKWAPVGSRKFFDEVDEQFKSDTFKKTGMIQWTIFSGETDPKKNWKGSGLSFDEFMATNQRYMKDYVPPPDLEGVNLLESLLDFINKECPEALGSFQEFDDTPQAPQAPQVGRFGSGFGRTWNRGNVPRQQALRHRVEVPLLLVDGDLYGKVKVGAHEQELSVLFDTGSHHIWVVAEGAATKDNQAYHWQQSTSFTSQGQTCEDRFGSGMVKGVWGFDTVKLGQGRVLLEIANQAIGQALQYQGVFKKFDALFGLGLITEEYIYGEPEPPLVRIAEQYEQVPVFGYYLNKFNPGKSKLIFGDDDGDLAVGGFKTHRVQPGPSGGYTGWQLRVDQFIIGDVTAVNFDPGTLVVPDSGSQAISGPRKYMEQINQYIFSTANIQVGDKYVFYCSYSQPEQMLAMFERLPPVHIVIDGEMYTLVAQDYIRIGKTLCRSFFDPADIPVITLGRPFMAKYYTKFDFSQKSVHFAKAKQDHGDTYVTDMLKRLINSGIAIPENLK